MNAREFLALLLPSSGVIFTAHPGEKGWINRSHQSVDEAVAHINKLTFEGLPAYFAMATFEKDKYWDPDWKNGAGEKVGKWRTRTQQNALYLKSFFLDLDVDPTDALKFASKPEALDALKAFVKQVGLPRPMIVDSGGGIHAYWPLSLPVPAAQWRVAADTLKLICVREKLKIDMHVTADQARVLRCLGGYNTRRAMPVQLLATAGNILAFEQFKTRLDAYADRCVLSLPPQHGSMQGHQAWDADDNLGATNDPAHFDRIAFACAQIQMQVGARGADVGEQLWRAALGIAKYCENTEAAANSVSDRHVDYDRDQTRAKLDNWHAGPTTCAHFHALNPSACEGCPHHGQITSPIVLGKQVKAAPAPVVAQPVILSSGLSVAPTVATVTLPEPPHGYTRRKNGEIVVQMDLPDGGVDFVVVCPVDLYPLSIDRQNGLDTRIAERSMWRAHLPDGPGVFDQHDFELDNKLLANNRELYAYLLAQGILMSDDQAKATGRYMSAYLKKMAQEVGRQQLYERLGWHQDNQVFVLPDRIIKRDGSVIPHKTPPQIRAVTKNNPPQGGTLDEWKQAMEFYNRPGYEANRFTMYCSFGSPLLALLGTKAKGALIAATGESGRGKSLSQFAGSSVWGHPDAFVYNGNKAGATMNAFYIALGIVHSLPFFWEDVTEREPGELRDVALNISSGQGKLRGTQSGGLNEHVPTWNNFTHISANIDIAAAMTSSGKEADAHTKRLFSVPYQLVDTSAGAKTQADVFARRISAHFGHAGAIFMQTVMANYDTVVAECEKSLALIDGMVAATDAAAARYWTAVGACAYTGAKIAAALGLIRYPVKQDLEWIVEHIKAQCESSKETAYSAVDVLTGFLNANLRATLTVSAKGSSNLDNIEKEPIDKILVRNERDEGLIWIEVAAIRKHFADAGRAYLFDRKTLAQQGILLEGNARKNLGSGTRYSNHGQVRCWCIDALKLAGELETVTAPIPSNVTPIGQGRAI